MCLCSGRYEGRRLLENKRAEDLFLVHKQGLCINLERWDGERDGREFQKGGDICIPMAVEI